MVSLETKLKAISYLDSGESIEKVSADTGVEEIIMSNWIGDGNVWMLKNGHLQMSADCGLS